MLLYTLPRETVARWTRLHDQIAVFASDRTTLAPIRTVEVAGTSAGVVWVEVIQPPTLVPGEVGGWLVTVAERLPDGRHAALHDLYATDGEALVIRERVAIGREVLGLLARESRNPFDVPDFIPDDGAVHAGEIVCGRWVDYGICAQPPQHDGRCLTRNDLLAAIVEGQPASPVGITASAPAASDCRCHDGDGYSILPAQREPDHDMEESTAQR